MQLWSSLAFKIKMFFTINSHLEQKGKTIPELFQAEKKLNCISSQTQGNALWVWRTSYWAGMQPKSMCRVSSGLFLHDASITSVCVRVDYHKDMRCPAELTTCDEKVRGHWGKSLNAAASFEHIEVWHHFLRPLALTTVINCHVCCQMF